MTAIARPELLEDPSNFSLQLLTTQRAFASPFGGSEQVIDLGQDRWTASIAIPSMTYEEAAEIEAFIASLRGMSNTVELFHLVRPEPRGTLRGTPVLALPIFVGDGGIFVDTVPGATLRPGDMVGVSGMLFQVREPAVANGAGRIGIAIVNRARKAVAPGASIIWDRPSVPFRVVSQPAVQYVPGYAPSVAFDFVEAIA